MKSGVRWDGAGRGRGIHATRVGAAPFATPALQNPIARLGTAS
jgi:hypothetical protein